MQLLMFNKAIPRVLSSIGWYMYRMCANAEDPDISCEASLHGPRLISRVLRRHNVVLVSCPSCCVSFDRLVHIWPRHTNAMWPPLLLLELIVDVVLLGEKVTFDLCILQQLKVSLYIKCVSPLEQRMQPNPHVLLFFPLLNAPHVPWFCYDVGCWVSIPLRCPHFSKWLTPSLR
jgi:hypothetical protein